MATTSPVIIVGAGIVGLSLANGLKQVSAIQNRSDDLAGLTFLGWHPLQGL